MLTACADFLVFFWKQLLLTPDLFHLFILKKKPEWLENQRLEWLKTQCVFRFFQDGRGNNFRVEILHIQEFNTAVKGLRKGKNNSEKLNNFRRIKLKEWIIAAVNTAAAATDAHLQAACVSGQSGGNPVVSLLPVTAVLVGGPGIWGRGKAAMTPI